ncbi:MAG: hypothetical protein ACRDJU_12090, partial [Actinomycetota bacterium]
MDIAMSPAPLPTDPDPDAGVDFEQLLTSLSPEPWAASGNGAGPEDPLTGAGARPEPSGNGAGAGPESVPLEGLL